MKILITSILALSLVCSSCSKKDSAPEPNYSGEYTLSGYILDEVTSAPISGAEVFILEKEGGILVQTPDKQIAFTKTDGKGYYEIKFPVQAAGYLYLFQARAQHKNYFTKPNPERITIAKSGQSKFDWKLEPPAYFKLRLVGSGMHSSLTFISNKMGSGMKIPGNADTSLILHSGTLTETIVNTWIYKGADLVQTKEFNLGILSPFDTTSYTINF